METLEKDICDVFARRAYDLAASVPNIKVFLNGKKLEVSMTGPLITTSLVFFRGIPLPMHPSYVPVLDDTQQCSGSLTPWDVTSCMMQPVSTIFIDFGMERVKELPFLLVVVYLPPVSLRTSPEGIRTVVAKVQTNRLKRDASHFQVKTFNDYIKLFLENDAEGEAIEATDIIPCPTKSERWQVVVAPSAGVFQQMSFVNSIATTKVTALRGFVHSE